MEDSDWGWGVKLPGNPHQNIPRRLILIWQSKVVFLLEPGDDDDCFYYYKK